MQGSNSDARRPDPNMIIYSDVYCHNDQKIVTEMTTENLEDLIF